MIILKKNATSANGYNVDAIEVGDGIVHDVIYQLKQIFNDPGDRCTKAMKQLKYLWDGITPIEDLKIDLDRLSNLNMMLSGVVLSNCKYRKVNYTERNCCNGSTKIATYYCQLKNEPVTALGCSKCKEVVR